MRLENGPSQDGSRGWAWTVALGRPGHGTALVLGTGTEPLLRGVPSMPCSSLGRLGSVFMRSVKSAATLALLRNRRTKHVSDPDAV
jgi:hypothetical protein